MDDELNIIPPDKDIFEKRPVSKKQREHLAKAREKAKATMDRRRKLEKEAKEEEEEEESEEEQIIEEKPVKKKAAQRAPRKKVVIKEETEDETELRRFEKFMRSMKQYENLKEEHQKDLAEAQKVKLSLDSDEYERLVQLVKEDDAKRALAKASPAEPQKKEEPTRPPPIIRRIDNHNYRKTKRFGVG